MFAEGGKVVKWVGGIDSLRKNWAFGLGAPCSLIPSPRRSSLFFEI